MSLLVAGADGCRGGWVCVLWAPDAGGARAFIASRFEEILSLEPLPSVIAADIPIGLPERVERGGRACDAALRARLGARQSAVFAVPARAAVMEADYKAACEAAFALSDPPRRVSKQCFNIFPKIREVDAALTREIEAQVIECHPEGAFWAMNGQSPLNAPKKVKSKPWPAGMDLRRRLLAASGFPVASLLQVRLASAMAGEDDLLDACACAWTAARYARGEAIRFAGKARQTDTRGLAMEIWA